MKQDKKRSRSSSSSSVSSDELNVSKDHDRSSVDSSSDSDVVEVEAKQSRKKKKHRHKHPEGDENDSSFVHEERNGKPHKHKCHHRHHHHHHHRHGHHKHHCRSKEIDERNHIKHKALRNSNDAEVVRIKQEPLDETDDSNSRMSQKSYSSRRQNERGQSSRTNGADRPRFEHHRETSNSSREREMERRRPRNEHSSEIRDDDRDARRPKEERKRSGRKNRWEAEDDALNRNHPIKQEPESEGEFEWGKKANPSRDKVPPGEKSKPNFGLSGKLTEDTNTFNGVVIKYSEPPEARKPKRRWRLYPFKGDQGLPTLYIHRQSSYLIGRDRKVADIPVDHPSCSKQHAALQYRLVPYEREDRTIGKRVRPYIIDLESSNGTFVNGVKIEARKYVEIMEKDVVKFGYSSREYVLLHEQSKDDELDDDVGANEEVPAE